MKIGLYDPYLDTLGGGEKYIFSIASCLIEKHDVYLFWDNPEVLEKAQKRFAITTLSLRVYPNIFSSRYSLLQRALHTSQFDAIVYMSDGSIPWLFAKKNILLFQFPVNWVHGTSLVNRLKLSRIDTLICYSDFVKQFLDKTFNKKSIVIPPAVTVPISKHVQKEDLIVSVGRFTKAMNAKKQDMLIDSFKAMIAKGLGHWRLILAGGVLPEDEDLVEALQKRAKGYPIEIHANISYAELMQLYAKAKIYWHAAGYGEDLLQYPERAEHFGITTVEAMQSGAVPVVVNAGGQKEIIHDGEDGYLWNSPDELVTYTKKLIDNGDLWKQLSEKARNSGKRFHEQQFCERIEKVLA